MLGFMFFRRNNHEIFNSIVCGVPVNVMNVFAFFCVCAYSVFVFPFIWLFCFYHDIYKSLRRLVQCFRANWELRANFIQNPTPSVNNVWTECFSCAVRTSRWVMICVAVSPFFTYDWCAAKRAWFGKKSFHADTICQEWKERKCLLPRLNSTD